MFMQVFDRDEIVSAPVEWLALYPEAEQPVELWLRGCSDLEAVGR